MLQSHSPTSSKSKDTTILLPPSLRSSHYLCLLPPPPPCRGEGEEDDVSRCCFPRKICILDESPLLCGPPYSIFFSKSFLFNWQLFFLLLYPPPVTQELLRQRFRVCKKRWKCACLACEAPDLYMWNHKFRNEFFDSWRRNCRNGMRSVWEIECGNKLSKQSQPGGRKKELERFSSPPHFVFASLSLRCQATVTKKSSSTPNTIIILFYYVHIFCPFSLLFHYHSFFICIIARPIKFE